MTDTYCIDYDDYLTDDDDDDQNDDDNGDDNVKRQRWCWFYVIIQWVKTYIELFRRYSIAAISTKSIEL